MRPGLMARNREEKKRLESYERSLKERDSKLKDYTPSKDGIAMVNATIRAGKEGRPTPGAVKEALAKKHESTRKKEAQLRKLSVEKGGYF